MSVSRDIEQQGDVRHRHKCLSGLLKSRFYISFILFDLSFFHFLKDDHSVNAARLCLLSNAPLAELRGKPFHRSCVRRVCVFCVHVLVFIFVYFSVLRPASLFFLPPPPPCSFIKYTCQSAVIIRKATGSVTGYEARADRGSHLGGDASR